MLKILKQELLFIPIMFVVLEVFRFFLMVYYPETALFDKGSELENFLLAVWQMVWITSASLLLLRVVIPPAYRSFKQFYLNFDKQSEKDKESNSIIFYLVFFFGLIWLISGRAATPNNELLIRKKLVDTLHKQLNVREATGHNDGVEVEKYLTFVNRYKGDSWCAAFTSWNLNAVGVTTPPNPKSGWSPNFATPKYTIWSQKLLRDHKAKPPKAGDCFTLYYSNLGRVGHVGFIVDETDNYFITIEGNTGLTGSRDGSGVHKYKRSKHKVYAVTNYITPYIQSNEKLTLSSFRPDAICFLPQKIDTVFGTYHGRKDSITNSKGQYECSRYDSTGTSRQFNNKRYCYSGQIYRPCEFTGNESNIWAIRSKRINHQWKAGNKMLVQRLRAYSTISAAHNRTVNERKSNEATRAIGSNSNPGAVFAQMG